MSTSVRCPVVMGQPPGHAPLIHVYTNFHKDIGSMVRALVLYWGGPGSIPSQGVGIFSAMLYIVMALMS